jgi:hypothetical protein
VSVTTLTIFPIFANSSVMQTLLIVASGGVINDNADLWRALSMTPITRDAPDTVFAGYPAGRISG